MSRTIPATASRRDSTAQGSILEYGERLNGTLLNLVNGTEKSDTMVNKSCCVKKKPCNLLEDGAVDKGFLNPGRVLSRRVLIDQCQGSVGAVK